MAVQSDASDGEAAGPYDRASALNAFKLGDVTFYWITRVCAISVLLILGGIILSLIAGAWPAIQAFGFSFLSRRGGRRRPIRRCSARSVRSTARW